MPVMPQEPINASLPLPRRQRTERLASGALRILAPGKINLNLLVGPRRPDGYHPLDSIVAKITLYDEVALALREDGTIRLNCGGTDCGPDEENLALLAAKLLAEGRDVPGAQITLSKHIPPGRGLGGGSSDAAAVLVGLNELWGLGADEAHLSALARQLGSDVPLFLGPRAARMTGRGERLMPVRVHEFLAVLLCPSFPCDTAEVYRAFDELRGRPSPQLPADLLQAPPSYWRGRLENHLTEPATRVAPRLADLMGRLARRVSVPICLTGSGSAAFMLCDDQREAAAVLAEVPDDLGAKSLLVQDNAW
jgi:4-diphosphocytidyl-2-C-methyl-D-erythritol kinase